MSSPTCSRVSGPECRRSEHNRRTHASPPPQALLNTSSRKQLTQPPALYHPLTTGRPRSSTGGAGSGPERQSAAPLRTSKCHSKPWEEARERTRLHAAEPPRTQLAASSTSPGGPAHTTWSWGHPLKPKPPPPPPPPSGTQPGTPCPLLSIHAGPTQTTRKAVRKRRWGKQGPVALKARLVP